MRSDFPTTTPHHHTTTTMPRETKILSVAQVLALPVGDAENASWVNDGFTARVQSIERIEKGKLRWKCDFADLTTRETIEATLFTAPKFFEGQTIEATGAIRRTEYKGTPQVSMSAKTQIRVMSGSAQQHAHTDTHPDLEPTPAASRVPATMPHPATRAPGGAQPIVNGQTVGMAMKEAISLAVIAHGGTAGVEQAIHTKEFWEQVKLTASNIIRISRSIEEGNLSPSPWAPVNNPLAPASPPRPPAPAPAPRPAAVKPPPGPDGSAFPAGSGDEDVPF